MTHIKKKRGCVNPNDGFKIQLVKFQCDMGIKANAIYNFNWF